jgi:hypothetical protein
MRRRNDADVLLVVFTPAINQWGGWLRTSAANNLLIKSTPPTQPYV